ncbi:MAG: 5-oxoprolinase subunit PxpB [Chloroflexi bacterium]|nr:5-oxoprolinase subunit PxpB [Chloroflexota bacterium]MYF80086.1 5-oxoprolinase subunit PxpB [Chloroflexota bacterium]MYK60714.1 5-oxoprolinase subunit PxpB [Chloroflexota bacterium]
MSEYPRILPANDSSILIEFGDSIDYSINAQVYALQTEIENSNFVDAVIETIPSYRSLLVEYDVGTLNYGDIRDQVSVLVKRTTVMEAAISDQASELHQIPVAYGGELGPDLETVAEHAGLDVEEVIAIHSGTDYHVFMLGFAPGFPYLGGMDERIACPRLSTPRTRVPAGSVGIAESQTGVYPNESPGGWQLIGRTPIALFDVDADPPAAMLPGTQVNFVPISQQEYEDRARSE